MSGAMMSDAFRAAVEAEDPQALTEALADDVVFRSPVVFKPYEGKPLVSTILIEGAMKVFKDFRYVAQLEEGDTATLVFAARVGNRDVDGLDLLRFDAEGKVRELMVMARPMSGLNALAEAMGREFERLGVTPPAA
jgi:ketosteroid isomerase-like protein